MNVPKSQLIEKEVNKQNFSDFLAFCKIVTILEIKRVSFSDNELLTILLLVKLLLYLRIRMSCQNHNTQTDTLPPKNKWPPSESTGTGLPTTSSTFRKLIYHNLAFGEIVAILKQ